MTPLELIARLEGAKEGSWELDGLVCETVFSAVADRDGPCAWASDPIGRAGAVAELEAPSRPQRYTRSLDAASTLVPEGWSWQVRVSNRRTLPAPVNRAVVAHDRTGMVLANEHCEAEAQTPALALCIAALRARVAPPGR